MNHFEKLDAFVLQLPRNPMAQKWGRKTGKKCKDCVFLLLRKPGSRNVYKCEIRGVSNSAVTDHRLNWDACGRYQDKF